MKYDRSQFDGTLDEFLDEARDMLSSASEELSERRAAGESGDRIDELGAFIAGLNTIIAACDNLPDTEDESEDEQNGD